MIGLEGNKRLERLKKKAEEKKEIERRSAEEAVVYKQYLKFFNKKIISRLVLEYE